MVACRQSVGLYIGQTAWHETVILSPGLLQSAVCKDDVYAFGICDVLGSESSVAIDGGLAYIFGCKSHTCLFIEFPVAYIFHVAETDFFSFCGITEG